METIREKRIKYEIRNQNEETNVPRKQKKK